MTNRIYKEEIYEYNEEILKPNTKTVDSTANVINKVEIESHNLTYLTIILLAIFILMMIHALIHKSV